MAWDVAQQPRLSGAPWMLCLEWSESVLLLASAEKQNKNVQTQISCHFVVPINCGILKKFATKSQLTCGKTRPRLSQAFVQKHHYADHVLFTGGWNLWSLGQRAVSVMSKQHSNHINSAPQFFTFCPWESASLFSDYVGRKVGKRSFKDSTKGLYCFRTEWELIKFTSWIKRISFPFL